MEGWANIARPFTYPFQLDGSEAGLNGCTESGPSLRRNISLIVFVISDRSLTIRKLESSSWSGAVDRSSANLMLQIHSVRPSDGHPTGRIIPNPRAFSPKEGLDVRDPNKPCTNVLPNFNLLRNIPRFMDLSRRMPTKRRSPKVLRGVDHEAEYNGWNELDLKKRREP